MKITKYSASFISISFFIAGMLTSNFSDLLVKGISGNIHFFQITFLRYLFSLLLISPIMVWKRVDPRKVRSLRLNAFRGTILFVGTVLWFYGVRTIPISTVTALGFSMPFFTLILSYLILKEKIHWHKQIATLLGLLGVLIILHPNSFDTRLVIFIILLSSFLYSSLDVLNKIIANKDSKLLIIFYTNLFGVIFSLFTLYGKWSPVTANDVILLIGLASLENLCTYLFLKASMGIEISYLAPFRFFELIIAALFGYLFFNEHPSIYDLFGGGIIIFGITTLIYFQRKRAHLAKIG